MASIRVRKGPRAGTTYAVMFRDGAKQSSETFPDAASAEQFKALVERHGPDGARRVLDARDGKRGYSNLPTVAEQVVRHIDALSGCEPGTIRQYRVYAAELAETLLGAMPIDAATRGDVAAWIRDQESRSAAHTIQNKRALVSSAMARAVDDELVSRNVAHHHRIAKTERAEMCFLTPSEFVILHGRATPHYRPFIVTLFGTGMRFSEATALRVQDVHLDDRTPSLTVVRAWKRPGEGAPARVGPPKTEKGRRTISLPREVVDALRPLLAGKAPGDLVFVNKQGRRIQQGNLHALWRGWIKDEGWDVPTHRWLPREPKLGKHPRIHDLRHSHASWMLAQGSSLFRLQYRLGHESITSTGDRYGHLQPDSAKLDAVEASWEVPDEPDEPRQIEG